MMRPDRGETDPAIAEKDGRDAMPGGGRQYRVPGRLPVVMGVNIDPARCDQQAMGVDLAARQPRLPADRGDPPAIDRQISSECRLTGPIADGAAANDDVVHGRDPSTVRGRRSVTMHSIG